VQVLVFDNIYIGAIGLAIANMGAKLASQFERSRHVRSLYNMPSLSYQAPQYVMQ
jgi:hypothetical protein